MLLQVLFLIFILLFIYKISFIITLFNFIYNISVYGSNYVNAIHIINIIDDNSNFNYGLIHAKLENTSDNILAVFQRNMGVY